MKAYLLKFWATKGIELIDAELSKREKNCLCYGMGYSFATKPYWTENREEAIATAESLRKNRISQLTNEINNIIEEYQKKIERLNFIDFNIIKGEN